MDSTHVIDGDGVLRRVPKLAIRNRTSDESNDLDPPATASSDFGSENERSTTGSSSSSQGVRTPMSARSLSAESVIQRRWSASQRQSGESSKFAPALGQPSQKKRGAVRSFLTLKEPSTSAWEEFAAVEKEKARQKGSGLVMGSGAHGFPSQKLPKYVPKVNSKWDGLPDNMSQKSMDWKSLSKRNRISVTSDATRDAVWTADSTVTGDSKMTKRGFAALSGKAGRGSGRSNAYPTSSYSYGSDKQPPALAFDSDVVPVENTEYNRPQTFLRDPSPPPQELYVPDSTAPLSPPELEGDDIPYPQELDANSAPNSPRTPPADGSDARPALLGIHYPELDSVQKEAELFDDRRIEAVIRANSSRRPINFSRPQVRKSAPPALVIQTDSTQDRSPSPASQTGGVVLSPTLKNPSGKIEPFLTDTFASHSRETGHIPQRVASTLQKEGWRPGQSQEEALVSPISPSEQPFQPSGIPEVTMRPATATSKDAAAGDIGRTSLESQSQVSLVHSIAPSEMSEQWQMSPRERLGLGSKIRKNERNEPMPWDNASEDDDDTGSIFGVRKGRLSPSPGQESRVKRLSWRLSTKK